VVLEVVVWILGAALERPNYIPAAAFAATWKARVQASSEAGTCWLLATEP